MKPESYYYAIAALTVVAYLVIRFIVIGVS